MSLHPSSFQSLKKEPETPYKSLKKEPETPYKLVES